MSSHPTSSTLRTFLHTTLLLYLFQLGAAGSHGLANHLLPPSLTPYWHQLLTTGSASLGGFVLGPLLYGRLVLPDLLPALRRQGLHPRRLGVLVGLTAAAMVLGSVCSLWNQALPLPPSWVAHAIKLRAAMQTLLNFTSPLQGGGAFLLLACLPALGEELLFRGYLQTLLQQVLSHRKFAVILTALVFSLLHSNPQQFLPLFWLGLFFGYLQATSNNLWYPFLAHLLNNAGVLVWHWAARQGWITPPTSLPPWPLLVIAIVGGLACLRAWQRMHKPN